MGPYLYYLLLTVTINRAVAKLDKGNGTYDYAELNEHSIVTRNDVFPYVVAILKKTQYLSAGALIDENFVLTAADALFLHINCDKTTKDGSCLEVDKTLPHVDPMPTRIRESKRMIRVRLGSINYKKDGELLPIKDFEIHPFFSDTNPEFDIALLKLAKPIRFTASMNPIRLQRTKRPVSATHFIVNSWPYPVERSSDELQHLRTMEDIQRRRMLQVSHLHPTEKEKCEEEMEGIDINATETLMCLDPAFGEDPCMREVGAPVVLNGILWGIMSSFRSEDCQVETSPSFVTLVAAKDVSSWIHAIIRGHTWSKKYNIADYDQEYEDEYDDNNL